MTNYQLISDYKNNDTLRNSFFELAFATFEINFTPWYETGAWDDNYCCYSYADGNRIIANVSVNLMTVHLQGEMKQAVQIGTVMTDPDYQQLGLAGKLMDHVLALYDQQVDFIYLFANDSVLDFYPKFGFHRYHESQFTLKIDQQLKQTEKNYRLLTIESETDLAILRDLAHKRLPNSQKLGISHNPSLLLFYLTLVFANQLYYFEDQQTLIIGELVETRLEIYDIIQLEPSALKPLLSQLINQETTVIQFFFTTDSQEFILDQHLLTTDDYLFIRPLANWPSQVCFPLTSHG